MSDGTDGAHVTPEVMDTLMGGWEERNKENEFARTQIAMYCLAIIVPQN